VERGPGNPIRWSGGRVLWLMAVQVAVVWVAEGARVVISEPFEGVTHYRINQEQPRRVSLHLLEIDPSAPGIGFFTTPSNGDAPGDTVHQRTRDFVSEHGLQIGINANFSNYVSGINMNLLNIAASEGDVYSPFYAGWPGINITADNQVDLVTPVSENVSHDPPDFFSGYDPVPDVPLYNAVGGNELILQNGAVIATWADGLHPRTAAGVTDDGKLLLFTVDGRNSDHSQGMSTTEVAYVLKQYGAVHGINLDGGGSTTLIFSDPDPRVVNVPVGIGNEPGTERYVGNNLGLWATVRERPLTYTHLFASFEHLFDVPTANGALFLRRPSYSGSTDQYLAPAPDDSMVVGEADLPGDGKGKRALRLRWSFLPGLEDPWLRVSTHTAPEALGQPIVSFQKPVRFNIHSNLDMTVLLLVRNTESTGDYGATGDPTGGFEFIGGPPVADGAVVTAPPEGKRVRAGEWTTLKFDLPNESVTGWDVNHSALDGNGVLETPRGIIQSLVFVPVRGEDGAYSTDLAVVHLEGFEVVERVIPRGPPGATLKRGDAGGPFRLEIDGVANTEYIVEVSEDLDDWTEAETIETDAEGKAIFFDPQADAETRRFYRLRY
jgi:hypothetical protein